MSIKVRVPYYVKQGASEREFLVDCLVLPGSRGSWEEAPHGPEVEILKVMEGSTQVNMAALSELAPDWREEVEVDAEIAASDRAQDRLNDWRIER